MAKGKVKFKTTKTPDGGSVHTYKSGRRVIMPAKAAKAPVAPVDPFQAQAEVDARTKYQPVQTELAGAQRAQDARGPQIQAWYENYKKAVGDATTANAAAAQQAQTNLTALGTAAATNDRAGQAQVTDQMQTDAASRGATVDPRIAAMMQQASTVRGGNLATSQALQNAQAFNQGTVDRQKRVAGEGSKIAALQDNAGKVEELKTKGVDLSQQIGDFIIGQHDKLKSDDNTQRLQNYLATGKLDVAKAGVEVRAAGVTAKAAEPNKYGYAPKDWNALTPAQRRSKMLAFDKKDAAGKRGPVKPPSTTPNKYGYPPAEWAAMTTAQRQGIIKKMGRSAGSKAGKSPWANVGAQTKEANAISSALGAAADLKKNNISRHDAAQHLLAGQKASSSPVYVTLKDPKTGKTTQQRKLNKDGTPVMQASGRDLPSFNDNPLALSVALDIAYDGHISRLNVQRLHAAGVKVNALGYPTKPKPAPARIVRPNPDRQA